MKKISSVLIAATSITAILLSSTGLQKNVFADTQTEQTNQINTTATTQNVWKDSEHFSTEFANYQNGLFYVKHKDTDKAILPSTKVYKDINKNVVQIANSLIDQNKFTQIRYSTGWAVNYVQIAYAPSRNGMKWQSSFEYYLYEKPLNVANLYSPVYKNSKNLSKNAYSQIILNRLWFDKLNSTFSEKPYTTKLQNSLFNYFGQKDGKNIYDLLTKEYIYSCKSPDTSNLNGRMITKNFGHVRVDIVYNNDTINAYFSKI